MNPVASEKSIKLIIDVKRPKKRLYVKKAINRTLVRINAPRADFMKIFETKYIATITIAVITQKTNTCNNDKYSIFL